MARVKVSPKYQVVIPRAVRELLKIKPGQKFEVLAYDGHIHLVRVRNIADMRGAYPGLDTTVEREPDRF